MKTQRSLLVLLLLLITAVLGVSPQLTRPVQAISTTVVISEFRTRGTLGGNDEFVEIHNLSATSVDISGWKLNGSNNSGVTSTRATVPASTFLNPGCFYLFTNATTSTGYSGSVPGNTTFLTGITDSGGLAILNSANAIIDQAGMDNGSAYKEGTVLAQTTSNLNQSYERKPGGVSGHATDTDNNATDFQYLTSSNPQNASSTCITIAGDAAPTVTSTSPADNATGIAANANITITFSEAVTITGTIPVVCATSGTQNVTPTTSDNLTFTLDPATDFTAGELCSVTVDNMQVADNDTVDPPDNMAADYQFDFTVFAPPPPPCTSAATITPIHDVQGNGPTSPLVTTSVTIEGIVVGDFQNVTALGDLNGFHVQEEDAQADADAATSEGVFVYEGSGAPLASVSPGDKVRVTGTVTEFNSGSITVTQITGPTIEVCSTGNSLPMAATPSLPMTSATDFERFEGMLVTFSQKLFATEHFTLGRFGEVVLSSGDRLRIPTDAVEPGAPAVAYKAANDLNRIVLDDAFTTQNPDPIIHPAPGLTAANTLRGGDTVTGLTGIMDQSFSLYRIQPAAGVAFTAENPRPVAAPSVGGSLTVAGMNLLNYFNTFSGCTAGVGGAATDCRGAENTTEFDRQVPKTVAAILEIDPDVLGINEIENDGYAGGSAISHLVTQLNAVAGSGTFSYIDVDSATGTTNALGTDAIKVGLIYKPSAVAPVGDTAALNTAAFVNGGDASPRNRASLLQAFEEVGTGEVFLVNINHFKSKGSPCTLPDQGDGQGNCSAVRTNAANELTAWIATDPTGVNDPDVLLIGDYNSYRKEDPIDAIQAAGYDNLVETLLGDDAYSYVFGGEWGYLDYAFASSAMAAQVSGVAEYHINADEPIVLDYNTNFKSANLQNILFEQDEFRMSDHDPVLVGLSLDSVGPDTTIDSNPPDPSNSSSATFTFSASEPGSTFECDLDGGGFAVCTSPQDYFNLPDGPHTFQVRAIDTTGNVDSTPASYTWTIDTTPPDTTIDSNPTDPSNSSSAMFTFSANEPGSTFECDLDGGGFAACTSPQDYFNLPDGPHTFQVRAIDTAGNVDPTPADYTWMIDTVVAPPQVFVAGTSGTADNDVEADVDYTQADVLQWDGTAWTTWFDGTDNGLPARSDIIALDVDNASAGSMWLSWRLALATVPGVGRILPQEIAYFDGSTFSRFFDGRDVGLTLVSERINGLEVLPGSASPIGSGCTHYLLISTMAGGTVRNFPDPAIKFTGEDVLGFCMLTGGSSTTGLWHLAFEGESNGLTKNSTLGLSASDDAGTLYFTTKNTFPAGVNKILPFVQPAGPLGAPVFDAAANGVSSLVDSIDYVLPSTPASNVN